MNFKQKTPKNRSKQPCKHQLKTIQHTLKAIKKNVPVTHQIHQFSARIVHQSRQRAARNSKQAKHHHKGHSAS